MSSSSSANAPVGGLTAAQSSAVQDLLRPENAEVAKSVLIRLLTDPTTKEQAKNVVDEGLKDVWRTSDEATALLPKKEGTWSLDIIDQKDPRKARVPGCGEPGTEHKGTVNFVTGKVSVPIYGDDFNNQHIYSMRLQKDRNGKYLLFEAQEVQRWGWRDVTFDMTAKVRVQVNGMGEERLVGDAEYTWTQRRKPYHERREKDGDPDWEIDSDRDGSKDLWEFTIVGGTFQPQDGTDGTA
ncbi:unnamed protein product [Vitrella brassicaformis CCMP3155]|uniref:Uncharacterized protein n=2 Tax=Vitrella brassicaformis TaxID=1169539 RepID=A0A0G4EIH0_VITBC|nr:unnamed protein product [Vitrella brassicaformis CCMP3155]|eukprot:CEL95781.1 unnamed protein product [Vitrella brassicaformis CCMP3155]